jgi:hypothetical protein
MILTASGAMAEYSGFESFQIVLRDDSDGIAFRGDAGQIADHKLLVNNVSGKGLTGYSLNEVPCTFNWYVNGTLNFSESGVSESIFTTSGFEVGHYNITLVANNSNITYNPIATTLIVHTAYPLAYFGVYSSSDIKVMDTYTQEIIDAIPYPTTAKPIAVTVSPDGKYVYTVDDVSVLRVIDTQTGQIIKTVSSSYFSAVSSMTTSPNGIFVYMARQSKAISVHHLTRYNTQTGTVFQRSMEYYMSQVDINENGTGLAENYYKSGIWARYNATTVLKIGNNIVTNGTATHIVRFVGNETVYVTNYISSTVNYLLEYNFTTGTLTRTVAKINGTCTSFDISNNGTLGCWVSTSSGKIYIINLTSGDIERYVSIPSPYGGYWVDFTPDNKFVYISAYHNKQMLIYNIEDDTLTTKNIAGTLPYVITYGDFIQPDQTLIVDKYPNTSRVFISNLSAQEFKLATHYGEDAKFDWYNGDTLLYSEYGNTSTYNVSSLDVGDVYYLSASVYTSENIAPEIEWRIDVYDGTNESAYPYMNITTYPIESNITIGANDSQVFAIENTDYADSNFSWYIGGDLISSNESVKDATFSVSDLSAGTYEITVVGETAYKLNVSRTWNLTISVPAQVLLAEANKRMPNVPYMNTVNFTAYGYANTHLKWYLDDELVQTDAGDLSVYLYTASEFGEHNITVIANNSFSEDQYTFNITVKNTGEIAYWIDESLNVWFNVSMPNRTTQVIKVTPEESYMPYPEDVFPYYDDYSYNNTGNYLVSRYTGGAYDYPTYLNITDGYLHYGYNSEDTGSALMYSKSSINDSGYYKLVAKYNATGIGDNDNNQKEIGITSATITPSVYNPCDSNPDYTGWYLNTIIAMSGNNGQTSSLTESNANYNLDDTGYYPAIWVQDVSEIDAGSEIYVDYMYVRNGANHTFTPTTENEGAYYNVTLTNPTYDNTTGNGYQFYIAGASLGVTSQNDSLNITYLESTILLNQPAIIEYYPTVNDVYTSINTTQTFSIVANQTGNISWFFEDELQGVNESADIGNFTTSNGSVGIYNISAIFENFNGTNIQTWNWHILANGSLNLTVNSSIATGTPLDAEIYINDVYFGTAGGTPRKIISLPQDNYSLELVYPNYENYTTTFQIITDEDTVIVAYMIPIDGTLIVTSNVTGARVTVDDINYSTVPRTIPYIDAGNHEVVVSAAGYASNSTIAYVPPNGTTEVYLELEELSDETLGRLIVRTVPRGASVYLDGAYIGTTPVTGDYDYLSRLVAEGTYWLDIIREDYEPVVQEIEIISLNNTTVNVNLIPINGTLVVNSTPSGASIFINGVDQEATTPTQFNDMYPTSYNVSLKLDGHLDDYVEFAIPPNKTVTLNRQLYRPANRSIRNVKWDYNRHIANYKLHVARRKPYSSRRS